MRLTSVCTGVGVEGVKGAHTPVYGGEGCISVSGKFMCVPELVRRGPPRLVCQATLISCVTLGKFMNFSEPKFPRQDTWGNNRSGWVVAWAVA